jgi:hypothetical protein
MGKLNYIGSSLWIYCKEPIGYMVEYHIFGYFVKELRGFVQNVPIGHFAGHFLKEPKGLT